MVRVASHKYYIFMLVLYLFVFEFALMQVADVFKYIDELYAALVIPLIIINTKGKIYPKSDDFNIICLNFTYVLIGLFSNFLYGYQQLAGVLKDLFLNLKFVFGIYTTYYLFKNFDYDRYKIRIKYNVQFITLILFTLTIADEFIGFFPCNEIRYGLRSEQLFFGHPTGLASVSFFLLLMLMVSYKCCLWDNLFILAGSIILASTLRSKAIGALLVFIGLYMVVIIWKKRIKIWQIIVGGVLIVAVSWEQIYGYFFSPARMEMARGALLIKSFEIIKDFFPLGTGLGTYASSASGDYYSPIYPMYGLDKVWGLSEDFPAFVSDSFWPMVLGQTGFLGTIFFGGMLIFIIKKIVKVHKIDKRLYFVGLGSIGYLLISSTSESAFVNPLCLPLSILIGLCFIKEKNARI